MGVVGGGGHHVPLPQYPCNLFPQVGETEKEGPLALLGEEVPPIGALGVVYTQAAAPIRTETRTRNDKLALSAGDAEVRRWWRRRGWGIGRGMGRGMGRGWVGGG